MRERAPSVSTVFFSSEKKILERAWWTPWNESQTGGGDFARGDCRVAPQGNCLVAVGHDGKRAAHSLLKIREGKRSIKQLT